MGRVQDVRGFASRYRGPLVALGLLALAVAVYLPYALKGGWYYDDWPLYAQLQAAGHSWLAQFEACTAEIPAGRNLSCLYHVTEYHFLTDHRTAYHLVAIVFLTAIATMTYAILRRCRLSWGWAALAAALLVVFPASDSTRLWATGAIGQYVIALELAGVLIALSALGRPPGRGRLALHLLSLVLFALAMVTYEITVPLVALNGIVYWAAYRNRMAIRRGLVDLGLAFAFVVFRLVVIPVDPSEGFTVHRTIGENVTRGGNLVEAAWNTWHESFLPGAVGSVAIVALLLAAIVLAALDASLRRRLLPWALMLAGALVFALGATFVFQTANDLYIPQVGSLFNRVVLPASIPYVCILVALLGIGYELIRRFVKQAWIAAAAVVAVALLSGWHQLRISADHKSKWESSWQEQLAAIAGYDAAAQGLPEHSRIVGFGVPTWEQNFIPILAAPWDLRGMIAYTTPVEPPVASPLVSTMTCGPSGMVLEGVPFTAYRQPGSPLYFLEAINREAVRVDSRAQCKALVAKWGRPPFFADLS
jgi:hypothetical protein